MHDWLVYGILAAAASAAYFLKKLTLSGSIAGWVTASMIFHTTQWGGLGCLALFFLVGTTATTLNDRQKTLSSRHIRRGLANVISNTTGAWMMILANLLLPISFSSQTILLGIAVSQATALSDTLSSEIGQLYGKNCYSIISLKKTTPGDDGGISPIGLLAGMVGSLLITGYILLFVRNFNLLLWLTFISWAGNLLDSVLGATLQKNNLLNNHGVNAISNLLATLAYLSVMMIYQ